LAVIARLQTGRPVNRSVSIPLWSIAAPVVCLLLIAPVALDFGGTVVMSLLGAALISAVISAVHHAEVVAHKVGEPFGTIILALAVTLIEVALMVTLMLSGGPEASTLARDTVFATIMIILNGLVGLCLLVGGRHHGVQSFSLQGASTALVTLAAISVLTLVLPNYTTTIPGPYYSPAQLSFVAIVSLILYVTFIFVQTVRHRDYFLPPNGTPDEDAHAPPPSNRVTILSGVLLLVALTAVVLAAKALAPAVETAVRAAKAPPAVVGIIIAAIILLPEGVAAVRAARKNRLQTSLNLTLGSALASIGLTIPAVAVISITFDLALSLGLAAKETVLLFLSLFVASLSLNTGRTTVLQGVVHLVIFAVYLFVAVVP